jgi:hypothetical protein
MSAMSVWAEHFCPAPLHLPLLLLRLITPTPTPTATGKSARPTLEPQ